MARVDSQDIDETIGNLETVTKTMDEGLHHMLEEEKEIETELKNELHKNEELLQKTNKALQIIDQLEKLEKRVEEHEENRQREKTPGKTKKALDHDIEDVDKDIKMLKSVIQKMVEDLKELEQQSEQETKEVHNFDDIVGKLVDGEEHLEEMENRLQEVMEAGFGPPYHKDSPGRI